MSESVLCGKPAPGFHLHVAAGEDPLLVLLCQTEASEKGREFQLCPRRSGRQARRLSFALRRVSVPFEPVPRLGFILFFVIFNDLIPEPAIDPQRALEAQAAPHAGDPSAKRAADGEQAASGLRERLQTGLTERVATVEQPRDTLQTSVRQKAHAALGVLAQHHVANSDGTTRLKKRRSPQ